MPVCERYEVPLPMKMAHCNMPLHVQAPESEYIMEDRYHDNGMTSPHELGPWIDDQSEGGGKFRLKRRRRCGQCGPCQVKENCGKCQYCVRKDVLKQACIYRKCVYLRKPVPRFRPEAAQASSNSSSCSSGSGGGGAGGGVMGPGGSVSGASGNGGAGSAASKSSPQKPSTPSATSNQHSAQPAPSPYNPVAPPAAAAAAQPSSELSSCQLAPNPFSLPSNSAVVEPLAGCALEQQRNGMYDNVVDPSRTSYLPGARSLDSGRSPALDPGRNTNTADSGFGTGSSMTTSPASSVTKDRPSMPCMEQFRPPVEQWGPMPYGFSPRPNPWAHPAFQPSPATAYGFQPNTSHYHSPFASSCRLGMPDPTAHLATASQPSFHHNMPFARQDFSGHPGFPATAPSMQPAMTPPFYPPPPHIPPSLPNFPSFSQLPSSAGPHTTFPMAHHHHHHPSMYPGNFYPSFRPPTEPQIYHAHLPPPYAPFMQPNRFPPAFPSWMEKDYPFRKRRGGRPSQDNEEEEMKKRFSIFRIPNRKRGHCDVNADESNAFTPQCLTKQAWDGLPLWSDWVDVMSQENDCSRMLLKTVPDVGMDDDLQQEMGRISGWGECDVISIDDLKMHAFIRSDGFNNLEIEIESPVLENAYHKTQCLPDPSSCDPAECVSILSQHPRQEDVNNNSISEVNSSVYENESARQQEESYDEISDQNDECDGMTDYVSLKNQTEGQDKSRSDLSPPNQTLDRSPSLVESLVTEHSPSTTTCCRNEEEGVCRTLSSEVVVCLIQEGEGGVTEVEVPGAEVQLEDVQLSHDLLATSSDPQQLLEFLSQHQTVAPSSPDLVFYFEFDRDQLDDFESPELDHSLCVTEDA